MQNKYVYSPQSLSSNLTVDTLKIRKPRFQRKNTSQKCDCKSTSKSQLSCDSISLQKLYVKRSFLKSPANSSNEKMIESQSHFSAFQSPFQVSQINRISSSLTQNKIDCQFLENSNKFSQLKIDSFLFKQNDQEIDIKEKIDKCLKENIFYKQKCQKLELKIKDMISEKEKSDTQFNLSKKDNQRLRIQIEKLKKTSSCQAQKENFQINTPRKHRISFNKNLSKLKQEYVNFREEEELNKTFLDQRFQMFNKKIEQLKARNEKLYENLLQQEELYNMKLKMAQQKQDFLEKTLSYTKYALSQLQKDFSQKQSEILESKRLKELINEKNSQLEKIQFRYNNLLKIVNGEKRRQQNLKSVRTKVQKTTVPIQLKSKHSLETKNVIFDHKQNNQQENPIGKGKVKNHLKFDKNSIVVKVINSQIKTKQNYRIAQFKTTLKQKEKQIQQKKVFKRSNSDHTFSSFNSLELSPEK